MDDVLTIRGLCKQYPAFSLNDVGFSVARGSITGFVGRNGAGKTTTLKSILGLCRKDSGEISFFGLPFEENEAVVKQRIGYAGGAVNYYPRKKIKDIVKITKSFYEGFDDACFAEFLEKFSLDAEKSPRELSEGMKVKFNLALALSHGAELLILDEPTSGLDPVSREELLEVFLSLAENGVSILFSTHIISDLEKCADHIVYLQKGKVVLDRPYAEFCRDYLLVKSEKPLPEDLAKRTLGHTKNRDFSTYLIRKQDADAFAPSDCREPTVEDVLVHLEKEA